MSDGGESRAQKLYWTGSARVDFEGAYVAGMVSRRACHLAFRFAGETAPFQSKETD